MDEAAGAFYRAYDFLPLDNAGRRLFLPMAEVARPGEAEIRTLAVDPASAGRGIGEALTRRMLDLAVERGFDADTTEPYRSRLDRTGRSRPEFTIADC